MRNGLRATRAEDIARAAGIAPRTFYRYFASKEESLGPLFAAGVEKWAETVRDAPADLSVPEALRHAVVATMTPGVAVRRESWEWVRSLLRLAEGSPALLRVWGEECQMAERTLAGVLAARISAAAGDAGRATGAPPAEAPASAGDTAARAGTSALVSRATSGDRPAPAGSPVPTGTLVASGSPATPAATSRRRASADRSIPASSQPPSSPEPPPALSPELRLSAAVAGAAVRVAVEAWAAGDAAADGPDGPVALAVRNLAALRDFPWSAERATT
jgi:AcrR family transcriptional regulator